MSNEINEELVNVYTDNQWKVLPKREALGIKIHNLQKRIRILQSRLTKLFDEYNESKADDKNNLF